MSQSVTRRTFLGTAAAAGAGVLLPGATSAARRTRRRRKVDVAIVGAGLAGLTAARQLSRAGLEVCVVEARDRVGGRTLNHTVQRGVVAEVGGQYVGPTQDRVLALAKAMGVGIFPTFNDGNNVLYAGGQRSTYPAVPGLSDNPDFQQAILNGIGGLDPMAAEVPVAAPVDRAQGRRVGRHDARRMGAHEHSLAGRAKDLRPCRRVHLGSRAARAVAPLRALLHRGRGQRDQQGQLHAPDQHRRRGPGEPLRRRFPADRAPGCPAAGLADSAGLAGAADRAGRRAGADYERPRDR